MSINIKEQRNIVISNSGLFDTSQKQGFDKGLNFPQFSAVSTPTPPYFGKVESGLVGRIRLMVDPGIVIQRYTPMTLDTVLSLIGGQLSLFMWVLTLLLMYYHYFNMETALI